MMFEELAKEPATWLSGEGPESEVVLSSRIRLARNLREFKFPPSADTDTRDRIINFIRTAFESADIAGSAGNNNMHQVVLREKFLMNMLRYIP